MTLLRHAGITASLPGFKGIKVFTVYLDER
jgi:hypothetical protein